MPLDGKAELSAGIEALYEVERSLAQHILMNGYNQSADIANEWYIKVDIVGPLNSV